MPVLLTDCKKGDTVFFRRANEPEGTKPAGPMGRIGRIVSINKSRGTLSVRFRAEIDGEIRDCQWYISPADVIGFHVSGTPF